MNNQDLKKDAGKLDLTLVPTAIIRAIAKVRHFGILKYTDRNSWRQVEPERYRQAMYRHFLAYIDDPFGADEESGLPHLWHLACNAAFLIALSEETPEEPPLCRLANRCEQCTHSSMDEGGIYCKKHKMQFKWEDLR